MSVQWLKSVNTQHSTAPTESGRATLAVINNAYTRAAPILTKIHSSYAVI